MNDPNKHEKSLDRPAFVKAFQSKQTEQTPWDANSFEGKALKGLQHLKVDTDLSGILNELDQRIDRARPSQKVRRGPVVMRRWIAIAAGILLLLLAGIFLFQSPDSQQLAEQYFEPFPDALSAQTRGDEVVEYNLNSALRHYQDGAYDVAISYFETYVSIQNPDAVAPLLYQGVSHLALKQYAEALPLLEKVRSSTALRKEYRNAAQWYLAIAYLGLEQEEQARPLLIDLARRENFFQEKAGALMASM